MFDDDSLAARPQLSAPDGRSAVHDPSFETRRGAFDAAVLPHLDAMSAAAGAVVPSPDAAWDAVQDVLSRVWRQGWLPDEPRAALCHLARLAGRQQLRAARRRCHHETCAATSPDGTCRYEDDPSIALERAERRALVRRALEELRPDHRALLQRTLDDEPDYRSLAAEFGVPVGTVRSRLHRAKHELRKHLERDAAWRSVA